MKKMLVLTQAIFIFLVFVPSVFANNSQQQPLINAQEGTSASGQIVSDPANNNAENNPNWINEAKKENTIPTNNKIDLSDVGGTVLGKYKDLKPEQLEQLVERKGNQGIRLFQKIAIPLDIIFFMASLLIIATGPTLQHGYTMWGIVGALFCVFSFIGIVNAPLIMYIANHWALS